MLEHQRQRGVTAITTLTASAILIAEIIASNSRDLDHAKFGFQQLLGVMLATAQDRLAARAPPH
jgi:hypothetical protein